MNILVNFAIYWPVGVSSWFFVCLFDIWQGWQGIQSLALLVTNPNLNLKMVGITTQSKRISFSGKLYQKQQQEKLHYLVPMILTHTGYGQCPK